MNFSEPHIFPRQPTVTQCVERVARLSGVSVDILKGRELAPEATIARHWAMFEARRYSGSSLNQIGRVLGGRDHTTILYGIRQHAHRQGIQLPQPMKRSERTRRQLTAQLTYWRAKAKRLQAELEARQ